MVVDKSQRKIAFVGTLSVGKTTLINHLKQRHKSDSDVVFVGEAARIFFTDNPTITDRFSIAIQRSILDLQLRFEKEAHSSGAKTIFCDRSVIDAVAYRRFTGDIEGSNALLDKVYAWLPTYHRILLLDPMGVPYEKDDIRQEDDKTRLEIHNTFLKLFKEKRIIFELLSGTVEQRLARVNGILKE